MNEEIYTEEIMDEYRSPYHRGHLANPTIAHQDDGRPNCSDIVHLELLIGDADQVKEAWFDGEGCAISQAAASFLTREIEGKTINDLRGFQAAQMLRLLPAKLTPARQKCALLSFKVLKTMIYALDEQKRGGSKDVIS
jgi:nitrogen fixation NifU-like protein